MNRFSCCMDCEKREPGCHGKCEKYKSEKEKHAAAKDVEISNRKREGIIHTYFKDSYEKKQRRGRRAK